MKKNLPWFEIILSIVVLGAYVYAALSDAYNMPNRWFIRDDAYYYFKVAQNISEGHGSSFDGIHPTNGYHPLWMLVCVPVFALARYDLILPLRVLVIITGLLQVGTTILLYRLVRGAISPPVAVLAAVYWVTDSYILVFLYRTGVESSIALFFILVLLTLALRLERSWRGAAPSGKQIAWIALAAVGVTFSRLDLVFFALVMGVWVVFRGSPLRYLLPLDLLAIFVSTLAAFLLRLGLPAYYEAATAAITMFAVAAVIDVPTFYLLGLYGPPVNWRTLWLLARTVAGVAISAVVLGATLLIGAALHLLPPVSRATLVYNAGLTLGLVLLIRLTTLVFRSRREADAAPTPMAELRANWRTWLREGAIYYGILGGGLSLYMLWNKLAFGSFSPVSGEVKRWWGTFLISVYGGPAKDWLAFFTIDPRSDFNAWQPATSTALAWNAVTYSRMVSRLGDISGPQYYLLLLGGMLVIGFCILLLRRKMVRRAVVQTAAIPLFAGSWFQALSYNATGYASLKEWYWLTQPLLLLLLAGMVLNSVIELTANRWIVTRIAMWILVGGVALQSGQIYVRDMIELFPYGQAPKNATFADVVPFIEARTKPGAIIGMTGGGNVGYFIHDRTIVNMDGLINSTNYFADLKAGTASSYLYDSGMRYVFANPDLLSANPYRGQYNGRLLGMDSWGGKDLMKLLPAPSE